MSPARRAQAFGALFALTAINLLNYADRYVLGGLQELLKRDPTFAGGARDASGALADASLGTLTTAFFIVYMIASPFTGYLGDRIQRRYLVAGGVFLWSLATFASGLSRSWGELLVARAFIGIGEAGYAAVAPSLLADLFDRNWRGKAMGIFYAAIPVGAAVGFTVGGAVGAAHGWRSAFFVAGVPGLLLALFALALPEPARGAQDDAPEPQARLGPVATLRALAANRGYLVATGGMTLMTFAVGGLANWMPSFLIRFAGLAPAQAGAAFGAITAVAGLLATASGTWLGEVAERRRGGGYLLVSGVGLLLAAPATLVVSTSPGTAATLAVAFVALFFALLNTGPLNTALVNSVPAHVRASAVAVNIFVIHLLGDAISPTLVGFISDWTGSLAVGVAANAIPLAAGGVLLVAGRRARSSVARHAAVQPRV